MGFKACTSDQYIYINKLIGILIIIYVNNILIISKNKAKIKALKKSLIRRFEIEDLGYYGPYKQDSTSTKRRLVSG